MACSATLSGVGSTRVIYGPVTEAPPSIVDKAKKPQETSLGHTHIPQRQGLGGDMIDRYTSCRSHEEEEE